MMRLLQQQQQQQESTATRIGYMILFTTIPAWNTIVVYRCYTYVPHKTHTIKVGSTDCFASNYSSIVIRYSIIVQSKASMDTKIC